MWPSFREFGDGTSGALPWGLTNRRTYPYWRPCVVSVNRAEALRFSDMQMGSGYTTAVGTSTTHSVLEAIASHGGDA